MSLPVEHYLRIWLGRQKSVAYKNFSQAKYAEIENLVVALKSQRQGSQIETQSEKNKVNFIEVATGKMIASITFDDKSF